MVDGTKGLEQSRHNLAAGSSQYNAPTAPEPPNAPHNAPHNTLPETQAPQKIKEMKEWQFLSSLIERDGAETAIRAAAKDFL